ncbi:hypothetical protein PFISCL1PPCAC_19547, partial [Pristionchus fissidentatus]
QHLQHLQQTRSRVPQAAGMRLLPMQQRGVASTVSRSSILSRHTASYQPPLVPVTHTPIQSTEHEFHSMTRTNLRETVAEWNCVGICTKANFEKGGFGVWTLREDIVHAPKVLMCGHFMCDNCLKEFKAYTSDEYNMPCPRCNVSHSKEELNFVPRALHIADMIGMLIQPGHGCSSCAKEGRKEETKGLNPIETCLAKEFVPIGNHQEPKYPRDLMVFCRSCFACFNFSCSAPKPLLMCIFCSMGHDKTGHSHRLLLMTRAMRSEHPQPLQSALTKSIRQYVDGWHLAFLSQDEMLRIARNYLQCKLCGHPYSNKFPEIRPRMLDCGHIVCSECAAKNVQGILECTIDGCTNRRSVVSRPVIDLQWVTKRNREDFAHCFVCDHTHTKELCAPHRNTNADEWLQCGLSVCLYCRFGGRFETDHEHSSI